MEKIKVYIVLSLLMMYGHNMYAQIGYQISLLNTATGEPRANETVNVTMTLTNSEGKVIYTGNQSATTNDFGVLSLTIGDADTFKEVDLSKLPFFIEVSANGVMIGKSQVLNVPVAEVAKRLAPLDDDLLLGTWSCNEPDEKGKKTSSLTFKKDRHGELETIMTYTSTNNKRIYHATFQYITIGPIIWFYDISITETYYDANTGNTHNDVISGSLIPTMLYANGYIYPGVSSNGILGGTSYSKSL